MKLLRARLKQIKNLETRINPDSSWVSNTRAVLMTQIAHTSKQAVVHKTKRSSSAHSFGTWTDIFVPHTLRRAFKPAFSVALALIVTSAGWIASAYAEPGDMLWSAKNTINSVVETGRLVLASDGEQASLRLSYASKQAQVVKQVVESDVADAETKAKLIEKTVTNFQKKLDSAAESIKATSPEVASELVKEVSLSTLDIAQTLKDSAASASAQEISSLVDLEKTAADATVQGLAMIGTTVEKKAEANIEISVEEKQLIKEHIDSAVQTIEAETTKAETKLHETSASSSTIISLAPVTVVSSSSSPINLSIDEALAAVKTSITEQKKTVDALKDTNILEAINTTKILVGQVTTVTVQVQTGVKGGDVSTIAVTAAPTTTVSVLPSVTSSVTTSTSVSTTASISSSTKP